MRPDKQYLLDSITEPMKKKGPFVLLSYEKISANKVNQFRRDVKSLGGTLKMMRKQILIKACAAAGVTLDAEQLPGHISVIFSGDDAIETTKLAFKFCKESDKTAQVVGGRIEEKLYNSKEIYTLSTLPTKDELRSQFLATLEAVPSQTLAVMEALILSVPYLLDNKCKKESDGSSDESSAVVQE